MRAILLTSVLALSSCSLLVRALIKDCSDGERVCIDGALAICQSGDFVATPCQADEVCQGDPPGCVSASCGDNVVDSNEECDDGNNISGDGCASDCIIERCGDGAVNNINEVCDDSNATGGDGCSADCLSDETCGNNIIDTINGETCDDGNTVAGDGCEPNCQGPTTCGNATLERNEECDDGNDLGGDGCSACISEKCNDNAANPSGHLCLNTTPQQIDVPGSSTFAIATGNFDGDAFQDLILADFDGPGPVIFRLLNTGTANFNTQPEHPADFFDTFARASALAVGNWDNDNKDDFAAVGHGTNSLLIYNSSASFTSFTKATGETPVSAVAADANQDQELDLLASNTDDDSFSSLLGNGTGGFNNTVDFSNNPAPSNAAGLVVVPLNAVDNLPDVALARSNTNQLSFFLNDGSGGFTFSADLQLTQSPREIAAGDIDGDNDQDLAISIFSGNRAEIIENIEGAFSVLQIINLPPNAGGKVEDVELADLTNDGAPELLVTVANSNNLDANNRLFIFANNNGQFLLLRDIAICTQPVGIAIGDWNNDQEPDVGVACQNGTRGNAALLLSTH